MLTADVQTTTAATAATTAETAPPDPVAPAAPPGEGGSSEGAASTAEVAPAAEPTKLERARAAADKIAANNRARRAAEAQAQSAMGQARASAQQAAQERQARERAEAQVKAFETDFLGEGTKRGLTSKAVAQAAIDSSTPEAIARRALEEAAEARKETERIRQENAAVTARANAQQLQTEFLSEAKSMGDDFPHVASHAEARPRYLLIEADAALSEVVDRDSGTTRGQAFYAQHGRVPTHREVLEFLEYSHAEAEKARQKRPAKGNAGTAAPGGATTPTATVNGARTLTSRTAERAALPKSFDDMDPDERRAHMARQLRESTRA